ncbi:hypothetical protein KY320_01065 [Candidatus Woesearchaeota archaeon]|nr:hypothetical protein [Candidatus Woesearchaeota archaeon]
MAEQNVIDLNGIVTNIGGRFMFAISIVGIFLALVKREEKKRMYIKYALLLTVWYIGTIYASTKGVRWVLLLVPAFSIAFGVFAGVVVQYLSKIVARELNVNIVFSKIALVIVLGLLFVVPSQSALYPKAVSTAKNEIPSMNDAWVNSLEKIKINSSEDAIINSWWDFGHWFKYWADRAVTFDGTSQTGDRAHFIGRVLLTPDEEEAINIIRMLDCSGFEAVDTLQKKTNDSLGSVLSIIEATQSDRSRATQLLREEYGTETAKLVIDAMYCEPPEDFFIASEDMVGKSGVWAHFGSWNFTRASMVNKVRPIKNAQKGGKILVDEFGLSEELANQYYYEIQTQEANNWIAPWPSYSSAPAGCQVNGMIISCGNGLILNMTSGEAYADTPQGRIYPMSFSCIDPFGMFRFVEYDSEFLAEHNSQPFGVAFFPEGDGYNSVLMTPELPGSMFTRMFYYKGYGLKYFKPFDYTRDISGLDIYVYKIDWEGS